MRARLRFLSAPPSGSRLLARAGALAAGALATALLATPAGAAGPDDVGAADADRAAATSYVALGDSYSSGTGTREYLDDGSGCQRSALAYPSLIAAQQGHDLNFRACSGATIPDVISAQLDALSGSTGLVTISVGGNDAGFADVLTECALPGWASDCDAAIDGAQAVVGNQLPGRLGSLYTAIRAGAPAATVVVVGYPRVFMGEDCDVATFFSPEEQARLNQTADQLNGVLRSAAAGAGFSFADPTSAFTGHAVCDDPAWINGFSNPISDSYHPNAAGHASGYAPLVGARTGAAVEVTPELLERARAQAPELAEQQRRYAGVDRSIEQESVRAPQVD